jgi:tetratricopeptide (TPR) repeat protein
MGPWCDEIVACSEAGGAMVRLAASLGIRVYHQATQTSLAEVRNASLRKATGDWILWLESDEILLGPNPQELKTELGRLPEHVMGITASCVISPGSSHRQQEVRLFRNRNEILFEPSLDDLSAPGLQLSIAHVTSLQLSVANNSTSIGESARGRHLKQLIQELHKDESLEVEERKRRLGNAHFQLGNLLHAECYLHESVQRSPTESPHASKAWNTLVRCYSERGDWPQVVHVATEALERYPDEPELTALLKQARQQKPAICE